MKIEYKNLLAFASILMSQQAYSATVTWSDVDYSAGINDVFTLDVVGKNFTGNVDGGGEPISTSYINGSVTVSNVPVPAAAWLFGSSLLALTGLARKRS